MSGKPVTTLVVHCVPRARRTEVVGRHGDAIRIRLAAPPVNGAANDELVRFVAEKLGLSRSAVRIVSGATGRRKRIAIDGVAREAAERVLLKV